MHREVITINRKGRGRSAASEQQGRPDGKSHPWWNSSRLNTGVAMAARRHTQARYDIVFPFFSHLIKCNHFVITENSGQTVNVTIIDSEGLNTDFYF